MSTVKVNTVDKRTGSTLTLGGCGTTVTLGAGATQSGFGRTGTVDWCTTAKTAPFTGVSGKGYFVNTTCGAITVTLPATPTAGDIVSLADYASNWSTNAVTLCRNSSKINGSCNNAYLSTAGSSTTFIYVDGTRGWKLINDATENVTGEAAAFVAATGGTVTTCGNYKIHTFTADGCFAVSNVGNAGGSNTVDYMVVAGGGGGGGPDRGGGGGAGGYRESSGSASGYTASPLGACVAALSVTASTYPITVGAGGSVNSAGSNSIFNTITSTGGGRGCRPLAAGNGGSGGGGGIVCNSGGTGNTPPVSPSQGNNGGSGTPCSANTSAGGGGGGSGVVGSNAPNQYTGGAGGNGVTSSINASPTVRAGGGGGHSYNNGGPSPGPTSGGSGGTGGGGAGGPWDGVNSTNPAKAGTPGTANTGGGGGGAGSYSSGAGTGGSGIVIIRYKYQ